MIESEFSKNSAIMYLRYAFSDSFPFFEEETGEQKYENAAMDSSANIYYFGYCALSDYSKCGYGPETVCADYLRESRR